MNKSCHNSFNERTKKKSTPRFTKKTLLRPEPKIIVLSFKSHSEAWSQKETMSTLTGFNIISWTWCRDIVREALYEGQHTKQVQLGVRNGMLLFLFLELYIFISFFSFFHLALTSTP